MSTQAFARLDAFISGVKSPHLLLLRVFPAITSSTAAFNISSHFCQFFQSSLPFFFFLFLLNGT